MTTVQIDRLVAAERVAADHWHRKTNDGTCSRCREPIPDRDVPLVLWANDGQDMLAYCHKCLGIEPGNDDAPEE